MSRGINMSKFVGIYSLLLPPVHCSLFPPISPTPFLFSFLPGHVKTCFTSVLTNTNQTRLFVTCSWQFNNSIGINLRRGGEKPRGLQVNSLKWEGTNRGRKKDKIMTADRLKQRVARKELGCNLWVML